MQETQYSDDENDADRSRGGPDVSGEGRPADGKPHVAPAAWGAVLSLALCAAVSTASEHGPASLLTPIAVGLQITEGQTGQAISVSGLFAVLAGLTAAGLTRQLDRRVIVIGFAGLYALSGAVFAFAPNPGFLMVGRALLGIAIGGFWSMSVAMVLRLVPSRSVPKGLAVVNAGVAISATLSVPLASLFGAYFGWRGAFALLVTPLALLSIVLLWISLPSLPPRKGEGSGNALRLLRHPEVALGIAAVMLFYMGQRALYTYLRPFLQTVAGVDVTTFSLILFLMGVAGVAGSYVVGRLLGRRLFSINIGMPLGMAILTLSLIALGSVPLLAAGLLIAWSFLATGAPVSWGTWLARVLPNNAEQGGGLQVAAIQLAVTIGTASSGAVFDSSGWWSSLALSAAFLSAAALMAVIAWRVTPNLLENRP